MFVDDELEKITEILHITGVRTVQLHGGEPPEMCNIWPSVIKSFRVKDMTDLDLLKQYQCASAYLLDTYSEKEYGGTGRTFNWDIAVEAKKLGRVILAGGLTPDNVEDAVRYVRPYAIDVASGVEAEKGKKDLNKLKEFIERAKNV